MGHQGITQVAERQSQAQNNLIEKGIVFVDFPLGAEKQIEVSDVLIPSLKTILGRSLVL